MQELGEFIIEDLREASSWLLEACGAPQARSRALASGSSRWSQLLRQIEQFSSSLHQLLDELCQAGRPGREELIAVATPRRASPSRRPCDYIVLPGALHQLWPNRWQGREPLPEPDPAALDWLAYILQTLQEQLARAQDRIGCHLANLLIQTPGEHLSVFAKQQRESLSHLERELATSANRLQRCHAELHRLAWVPPKPQPRPPFPYPEGRAWAKLSHFAARLLDPQHSLLGSLHDLLGDTPGIADLPYLYQRWCGLRLAQTLQDLGWMPHQDLIPVLFLGGRIDFRFEETAPPQASLSESTLTLWVEPRIPSSQRPEAPHPCGLSAHGQHEATPDYVLTLGTPQGPQAWILDPSFSQGEAQARDKGRYRAILAFHQPGLIADVPTRLPPQRAWAAQPLARKGCSLHDPEGRSGTIPMLPGNPDLTALQAWLRDLIGPATTQR